MAGKVVLRNRAGESRICKVGFSWTTLFFGFFVPLLRKDWKWFGIIFGVFAVCAVLASGVSEAFGTISGIFQIVMAFMYNRIYINGLLNNGYEPLEEADRNVLNLNGWRFSEEHA